MILNANLSDLDPRELIDQGPIWLKRTVWKIQPGKARATGIQILICT